MANDNATEQHFLAPLIQIMHDLTDVIAEEITLLKTSRPKEVEKLLPAKTRLKASYDREMAALNARGGLQAIGNGTAIRLLKQETRRFQTTLTAHTRLVKALKKISEEMIVCIGQEVIKTQNQGNRYGADGTKTSRRTATSITLNQTV